MTIELVSYLLQRFFFTFKRSMLIHNGYKYG